MFKARAIRIILMAALAFAVPHSSSAGSVTITWDPNGESDLGGYMVLYGLTSGTYTNRVDVGNRTSSHLVDLADGHRYYFVVRAYNQSGDVSDLSNELSVVVNPCLVTLSATEQRFDIAGGGGRVQVGGVAGCTWEVGSDASWISVTSGAAGQGDGAVSFSVAPNSTASARTATIAVGGEEMTVTQAAGSQLAYFAEGATGPFFDFDLALTNPNDRPAPVTLMFLEEDGSTVAESRVLAPQSRETVRVDAVGGLESAAVSTVVAADSATPVLAERTMSWDASGYGGHGGSPVDAARQRWYFAEGSQGFFDTYLLLANPNPTAVAATVRFLTEGKGAVTRSYTLAPTSRLNVFAGEVGELAGTSFAMVVDASAPILAERSMYFGAQRFWQGGHESAGVAAPATSWFHAEGATGGYFDTYVLVANPNGTAANVTFTYMLPSGESLARTVRVPPSSRHTVDVEAVDPRLADTAVSVTVTADQPIVSERSMFWGGASAGEWVDAHNSFGLTTASTRWGFADGRVGGTRGAETFVLIANPNAAPAAVRVSFYREGKAPVVAHYTVAPTSRFNVHVNSMVPELRDEAFGIVVESLNGVAIAAEKALYWGANGVAWSAGTNVVPTALP